MAVLISDIINDARIILKDQTQLDGTHQFDDGYLCRILMGLGRNIHALSVEIEEETAFDTVAGTRGYAYPSTSFWGIVSVWMFNNGSYVRIPFHVIENLEALDLFSNTFNAMPSFCYLMNDQINFYPIPSQAYNVKVVSIKQFPEWDTGAGIATTLGLTFSVYFDSSYKDICSRYIAMKVLTDRGDKQGPVMEQRFYDVHNAQSDWRVIQRIENLKYRFNAENRRTEGVPTSAMYTNRIIR